MSSQKHIIRVQHSVTKNGKKAVNFKRHSRLFCTMTVFDPPVPDIFIASQLS